ncbi:MAG TPA: hypothetical protein VEN99_08245, partial [Acidimicrobiia bacterium]|nr:hypothetical protein [Acidimicrobiia bacterium]
IMIVLALFVAATAVAMVVRELGVTAVGWIGLPIAVILAVAGVAGFYNSGYESFWNGLNYVALLAFAAFVLVVAVEGLLSPAGADQVAPAAGRPVPTT